MNGIKYRNPEEMKDSRIEWLGAIPLDWNRGKIFYCFRNIGSGSTPNTSIIEYYENGNIPWLLTGNLNDGEIETITNYITEKAIKDNRTLKIYPKNTLVMAMYGATIGKLGILNVKSTVNQACCCLSDPRGIHNKFVFYYLLYRRNYIISLASGGGQPNINREIITKLKIPISSMKEQIAITNFLDYKTSQFDSIIQKKEQLIQKLEEAKKSLISEVVTGKVKIVDGVLVEKDPSEMKDSGVDWLGMIPKEWVITSLGDLFYQNKRKNRNGEILRVLSLSYGNIIERDVESNFGLLPESFNTYQIVKNGDIILRLTDLQNDKRSLRVGISRMEGIITFAYIGLKCKSSEIDTSFLYFVLHTYDLHKVFYNMGGGLRQTMRFEDLKKLPILFPSFMDQQKISNFLDYKTPQFDSMIENQRSFIEKLKQAKQSLISEAVTGKIDLRDWQIIQQEAVS